MTNAFDRFSTAAHKTIVVACSLIVLCAGSPLTGSVKAQIVAPLVHLNADGTPDEDVGSYSGHTAQPPIIVNTTADNANSADGECTLREAIANANADADLSAGDCEAGSGEDSIAFAIPGVGPHTIAPVTALPNITDPVTIDGTTQSGASCGATPAGHVLLVELEGSFSPGIASGLRLAGGSDGSTVKGFVINRFSDKGVVINNSHDNVVACNYIGTDKSGGSALGNGGNGIEMAAATGNIIENNLVSGNVGDGVHFEPGGDANIVRGNYIGTNAAGTAALGNTLTGLGFNQAQNNMIGGTSAAERNLISGNANGGMAIVGFPGSAAVGNTVQGNYIGTDVLGTSPVPNAHEGIRLVGLTTTNVIGGSTPGAGNVISGNHVGVAITAEGENNSVKGNFIGTNADGDTALGNTGEGVIVYGVGTKIGGRDPGEGNVISGNSAGIYVEGATDTAIEGNFIGTSADGLAAIPNGLGISVRFAGVTLIGGAGSPGARNVISGNTGTGIGLRGDGTRVHGNLIGLDVTGMAVLSNQNGVTVYDGNDNMIGGGPAGEGNAISGNMNHGVVIEGTGLNNVIEGNLIGTNADGAGGLGNGGNGVYLTGGNASVVRGNVISGNEDGGVAVVDVTYTRILDNSIGVAPDDTTPLGNGTDGIFVSRSNVATIENNVIAHQGGFGIAVDGDGVLPHSYGVSILRNRIFENGNLGIDLGRDGVSANDPGDGDEGPNGLMNHPTLAAITFSGGDVTVTGVIDAAPSSGVHLEFFANDACDFSGYGEGQFYLGFVDVTTDGAGLASISSTFSMEGASARLIAATATDAAANTSEFSRCVAPSIGVPTGHVHDELAYGLAQPQGLVPDGSGNLLVGLSGSGEIMRLAPNGLPIGHNPVAYGFDRPAGIVRLGQMLYVADGLAGAVYQIDLSSAVPVDASTLTPLVGGLNGPAHLIVGPDGFLYVTLMGGQTGEKVIRVDPGTGIATDHVSFSDAENIDPEGMAFAPNGDLYVALQARGEVVRIPASSAFPLDGSSLTPRFTDLEAPNGLGFGSDGRLYIATRFGIKAAHVDASIPTDYVTGLAGGAINNLVFEGLILSIADGSAGRVLRVTASKYQIVDAMPLTYTLHTVSLDAIGAGGAEAARAAFTTWQDVAGSDAAFVDGGTTTDPTAGIDGVNKVTVDESFPFPPLVLAVAAKTVVFGSTPGEGTIIDADVVINAEFVNHRQFPIGTEGEPGLFDLQSIVTHEVGHVLGLVHSGVEDATMYFVLQNGKEARSLTIDDEAWVGHRYPSATQPTMGSIAGHIADGVTPGAHIAGALVLATNSLTGAAVHAYSDEDGNYFIPGLPYGDYVVAIAPLSGSLRPANVSAYLLTIANNLTFEPEFWNDVNESENPIIDDPSESVQIVVNGSISGIDFITNQDIAPPTITDVFPRDGAANVAVGTEVLVTLSEAISASTLLLTLSTGGSDVPGSLVLENRGRLGVFTPDAPLLHGAAYEIRVDASLADISGNVLGADFASTFTTEPPDISAPLVEEVHPLDNAVDVLTVESVIVLFSEAMDPMSLVSSVSLHDGVSSVPGAVTISLDNLMATFTPTGRLTENTSYIVNVAPTVTDISGNALGGAGFMSTFTTGTEIVAIERVGPSDTSTDISVTTAVLADFTAPIDLIELSTATFQLLTEDAVAVPGTFEVLNENTRVIFRPADPLAYDARYTINIPVGGLPDPGQAGHLSTFVTASEPLTPTIASVSPTAAALGKTVVINGSGIDPNPANVVVTFAGVPAIVADATLTSVTTIVPKTATSGPLLVTIGGVASNAFTFEIVEPIALTDEVISKVTTDSGTRDGGITPDGTLAFVTNSGADNVSVIDLVDTVVEGTISVGETPLKIAITPNGSFAYVTNFRSSTVSVIDIASRTVAETIEVGLNPIGVAVTPDGSRAYVAEFTGKAISVIDIDPRSGAANQVVARVTTDSGNRDVAISPDGTLMLATGTQGVTILSIDPGTDSYNQVVAKVTTDTGTRSTEISPDGTYGFVTTITGEILVIDLNSSGSSPFQVIAKTTTDAGARDVVTSPDGTLLLATNFEGSTVTAYTFEATLGAAESGVSAAADPLTGVTVSLTPVVVFEVGTDPEGIVFAPSVGLALVANSGSDDVSIIRFGVAQSLPPADRIAALIDRVKAMVSAGEVKPSLGTSLLAHLQVAAVKLEKDDPQGAVKELELFIKKVEGLMSKRQLDQETGTVMVDEAAAVIADLHSVATKSGPADNEHDGTLPTEYALAQNYPNPFNSSTRIEYDIPTSRASERVELRVYDLLGRSMLTLVDEDAAPGRYTVVWDGRREGGGFVASGVYLVQMHAGTYREVRKVVVMR